MNKKFLLIPIIFIIVFTSLWYTFYSVFLPENDISINNCILEGAISTIFFSFIFYLIWRRKTKNL